MLSHIHTDTQTRTQTQTQTHTDTHRHTHKPTPGEPKQHNQTFSVAESTEEVFIFPNVLLVFINLFCSCISIQVHMTP